ncbi:hypothetical protein ADEAN_000011100 [Angomonas deanei]|uniref:Uncharacterized protein n=1 Tax=Angomonas deanei TaxID=59799 RepID=A0A7G2BYP8_9TRYP|nr:hypothetical protein ADEAN_000011100 [Angomonas deanei]
MSYTNPVCQTKLGEVLVALCEPLLVAVLEELRNGKSILTSSVLESGYISSPHSPTAGSFLLTSPSSISSDLLKEDSAIPVSPSSTDPRLGSESPRKMRPLGSSGEVYVTRTVSEWVKGRLHVTRTKLDCCTDVLADSAETAMMLPLRVVKHVPIRFNDTLLKSIGGRVVESFLLYGKAFQMVREAVASSWSSENEEGIVNTVVAVLIQIPETTLEHFWATHGQTDEPQSESMAVVFKYLVKVLLGYLISSTVLDYATHLLALERAQSSVSAPVFDEVLRRKPKFKHWPRKKKHHRKPTAMEAQEPEFQREFYEYEVKLTDDTNHCFIVHSDEDFTRDLTSTKKEQLRDFAQQVVRLAARDFTEHHPSGEVTGALQFSSLHASVPQLGLLLDTAAGKQKESRPTDAPLPSAINSHTSAREEEYVWLPVQEDGTGLVLNFMDVVQHSLDPSSLSGADADALQEVGEVLSILDETFSGRTLIDERAWMYGRNRIHVLSSSEVLLRRTPAEPTAEELPLSLQSDSTQLGVYFHEEGCFVNTRKDKFALDATRPRW